MSVGETSFDETTQNIRREQDSNLWGNIPLDFESNALTTRPSRLRSWDGEFGESSHQTKVGEN
jgi:hypothetical protein